MNFEKDEKLAQDFEDTIVPNQRLIYLSILTGIEIYPQNTFIVFDEI